MAKLLAATVYSCQMSCFTLAKCEKVGLQVLLGLILIFAIIIIKKSQEKKTLNEKLGPNF